MATSLMIANQGLNGMGRHGQLRPHAIDAQPRREGMIAAIDDQWRNTAQAVPAVPGGLNAAQKRHILSIKRINASESNISKGLRFKVMLGEADPILVINR